MGHNVSFFSGHGWSCHVCDSNEDGRCRDPFVYDSGRTITQDFEMECDEAMKEEGFSLPAGEAWSYCVKMISGGKRTQTEVDKWLG